MLSLDGSTILYTQVEGNLNPDWEPASWVHHWGGLVYRGFGYYFPEQGVDVVDVHIHSIIRHLDLDIHYSGPW